MIGRLIRITLIATALSPGTVSYSQTPDETRRRAEIEADLEKVRTGQVTEAIHRVGCEHVYAMSVETMRGDAIVFGAGGAAGGVSFARERESRWPLEFDSDIVDAVFDNAHGNLLLAGADGLVRRYRRGSFDVLKTYPDDAFWAETRVRSIAVSPDGTRLAIAGDAHGVRIFDLETGKELAAHAADSGGASVVLYQPDGTLLVGATDGRLLRVSPESVTAAEQIATVAAHPLLLAPAGGDNVAVVTADGAVTVRSLGSEEPFASGNPLAGPIAAAAAATDPYGAPRLLLANRQGRGVVVDGATLDSIAEIPSGAGELTAIAIDPFAVFAVTAFRGGELHRWNLLRLADEKAASPEGIDAIGVLVTDGRREEALAQLARVRRPIEERRIRQFLVALPPVPNGWNVSDHDWTASPGVNGMRSYSGSGGVEVRLQLTENVGDQEAKKFLEELQDPRAPKGFVQGIPAMMQMPEATGGRGRVALIVPAGSAADAPSRLGLSLTSSGIGLTDFQSQFVGKLDPTRLLELAEIDRPNPSLPVAILFARARNALAENDLGLALAALDAAEKQLITTE